MTIGKKVPTGTTLTPGAWYRITEIDPTVDNEPTLAVGDVIQCAADRESCVDIDPVDDVWFADCLSDGSFGTLITGLETSLSPTQLARKAELLKERDALFDDLRALKGAGNGEGACAARLRVKEQVDRVKAELAELEEG